MVALGFLTLIPVPKRLHVDGKKLAGSTCFFPACGLVLGVLSACLNTLSSQVLPLPLADMLTLLFLFLITGGLHTDGLADTFDGVLSGKGQGAVRAIMKDSRLGAHGAMALFFVLLIKLYSLNSLSGGNKTAALLLMTTTGRWSVPVVGYFCRDPLNQDGLGAVFSGKITGAHLSIATAFFLPVSFFCAGIGGCLLISFIILVTSLGMKRFAEKKAGRVTGDVFGAIIELAEMMALLCSAALLFQG
ncbi:MAG: adenosylcobinamide-GDP ribazoletransferase [Nitrospinota bacterium]